MKKLLFLLLLFNTAQAADIVPERVDMVSVLVDHCQASKPTLLQQTEGVVLVVKAVGLVGSPGWTEPTLVPRNDGDHAEDGYLEFDLKATPPANAVGVVESIEAQYPDQEVRPHQAPRSAGLRRRWVDRRAQARPRER